MQAAPPAGFYSFHKELGLRRLTLLYDLKSHYDNREDLVDPDCAQMRSFSAPPTCICSPRCAESPSRGSAGGVFMVTDFSDLLSLLRDLWWWWWW